MRLRNINPGRISQSAVAKAVFWSFFGVRWRRDYESDAARITPMQAIVAGLIGAAILITLLLLLVKAVTK